MRHLLKRVPISNRKWLLRVVTVATAAGSALAFLPSDLNHMSAASNYSEFYRGTRVLLATHSLASDMFSTPWRLKLYPFGLFEFGNHKNNFYSVASSQAGGVSSEAPSSDSKHGCQCLGRDSITNAAAKVGPAVVNLSVPQGFHRLTMGKSMGSGTIIDPDGTILTCAHVVVDFQGIRASSKGKVEVTLQDGRTFEGTVLHADLHSDVAIVKIKSKLPLPAARFGTSNKLRPGDWVISLGCPLSLQNTVTAGIVSCIDRKSSDLGLGGTRREYLQTDCAINPGNSGGPLVNMDGEVVGVNIMKVLAADGLSFAVPIDSVSKIVEHFKKNGRVIRPWLGLKLIDLNEMIIAQLKDRDPKFPNVDRGVLVPMVTPGSPADRAGFRPGDVVINFDGRPVRGIKEIIEIMGDKAGVPMKVVVKRTNDAEVILVVTPEEANPDM
ncbi:hypothetical protein V2J09_021179 [Rumex salicifolius]